MHIPWGGQEISDATGPHFITPVVGIHSDWLSNIDILNVSSLSIVTTLECEVIPSEISMLAITL